MTSLVGNGMKWNGMDLDGQGEKGTTHLSVQSLESRVQSLDASLMI